MFFCHFENLIKIVYHDILIPKGSNWYSEFLRVVRNDIPATRQSFKHGWGHCDPLLFPEGVTSQGWIISQGFWEKQEFPIEFVENNRQHGILETRSGSLRNLGSSRLCASTLIIRVYHSVIATSISSAFTWLVYARSKPRGRDDDVDSPPHTRTRTRRESSYLATAPHLRSPDRCIARAILSSDATYIGTTFSEPRAVRTRAPSYCTHAFSRTRV